MRKHSTRRLDSQRSEQRRPRTRRHHTRRARFARRVSAAVVLLAAVTTALTGTHFTETTEATWADAEHSLGTMQAGEVLRPQNLTCSNGLGYLDFNWQNPASTGSGVLPRRGYRWEFWRPGLLGLTNGLADSGTLAATATSVRVSTGLLDVLNAQDGQFRIYALGPGGWEAGKGRPYHAGLLSVRCGSGTSYAPYDVPLAP